MSMWETGSACGVTEGVVDDDLDEINSVSVRVGSDLTLLACAEVHPNGTETPEAGS
jgi:hypothetical protein